VSRLSRRQVQVFLVQAKDLIESCAFEFEMDRAKNRATLEEFGLRNRDIIEILQALQPRHYCHSEQKIDPLETDAHVFGSVEQGKELYIKLKVRTLVPSGELLICVSFHRAQGALQYPFKR